MIGFFGGSFDPFHNAHRALAEAALTELKLERLIVMPTANPPHRGELLFSVDERLALTKAGLTGLSGAQVSDLEARSTTPQYTFETLQLLSQSLGRRDWVICLGADSFLTLDRWHRAPELMSAYTCAVAPRVGVDHTLVQEKARQWGTSAGLKVIELKTTLPEITATAIRQGMQKGLNIEHLLPTAVTACLKSLPPRAKADH